MGKQPGCDGVVGMAYLLWPGLRWPDPLWERPSLARPTLATARQIMGTARGRPQAHLRSRPTKTPPKIYGRPPERKKSETMGGKKERNFGPPHPSGPTLFLGSGPLSPPPLPPLPLGPQPLSHSPYPSPRPPHHRKCLTVAKVGETVAKVGETVAKVGRGQSGSWPKWVVAKVGRGQSGSWPK